MGATSSNSNNIHRKLSSEEVQKVIELKINQENELLSGLLEGQFVEWKDFYCEHFSGYQEYNDIKKINRYLQTYYQGAIVWIRWGRPGNNTNLPIKTDSCTLEKRNDKYIIHIHRISPCFADVTYNIEPKSLSLSEGWEFFDKKEKQN